MTDLDKNIQPQIVAIRDMVHAAKLLKILLLKQKLIDDQLAFVKNYLKENLQ